MLGDTAVAVNPKDERYTHLHGKHVLLPLMNREIPIIADELAQPEFGTGAVKVTPAHDPNDFEAGLRHNLPQIEVIDEHAQDECECRSLRGPGSLCGARACGARTFRSRAFWSARRITRLRLASATARARLSSRGFRRSGSSRLQPLAKRAIEVVEKGYIRFTPENYGQIYLNWMRNIHDWCISRQLWWGHRIPAWYCANNAARK